MDKKQQKTTKSAKTPQLEKIGPNFRILISTVLGTENTKIYFFQNTLIRKIGNKYYLENFIIKDSDNKQKFFSRKPIKINFIRQKVISVITIRYNKLDRTFIALGFFEKINDYHNSKIFGVKNSHLTPNYPMTLIEFDGLKKELFEELLQIHN